MDVELFLARGCYGFVNCESTQERCCCSQNGGQMNGLSDEEEEEHVKQVIDWKSLWSELKNEGWHVKGVGKVNPLHNWYYICPSAVNIRRITPNIPQDPAIPLPPLPESSPASTNKQRTSFVKAATSVLVAIPARRRIKRQVVWMCCKHWEGEGSGDGAWSDVVRGRHFCKVDGLVDCSLWFKLHLITYCTPHMQIHLFIQIVSLSYLNSISQFITLA